MSDAASPDDADRPDAAAGGIQAHRDATREVHAPHDDTFELFDLRVTVEEIRGTCTCAHAVGDSFELIGGKLGLPPGQRFCLYALQAAIPLLPAKQRPLHPSDWMATDARIICPDPLCGVVLLIERTASRTLRHADVSAVPLAE